MKLLDSGETELEVDTIVNLEPFLTVFSGAPVSLRTANSIGKLISQ